MIKIARELDRYHGFGPFSLAKLRRAGGLPIRRLSLCREPSPALPPPKAETADEASRS